MLDCNTGPNETETYNCNAKASGRVRTLTVGSLSITARLNPFGLRCFNQ